MESRRKEGLAQFTASASSEDSPSILAYAEDPMAYVGWSPLNEDARSAGVGLDVYRRFYPSRPALIWKMRDLIIFIRLMSEGKIAHSVVSMEDAKLAIWRLGDSPPRSMKHLLLCAGHRSWAIKHSHWRVGSKETILLCGKALDYDFTDDVESPYQVEGFYKALDDIGAGWDGSGQTLGLSAKRESAREQLLTSEKRARAGLIAMLEEK